MVGGLDGIVAPLVMALHPLYEIVDNSALDDVCTRSGMAQWRRTKRPVMA